MRTTYNGAVKGSYKSLAFGDGTTTTGADNDSYHFAQLDYDYPSSTDHAPFRQYSPTQGRWLSPDAYYGSYDSSNPQSMNRYAYVQNNPLSYVDPSGLELKITCVPKALPAQSDTYSSSMNPADGYTNINEVVFDTENVAVCTITYDAITSYVNNFGLQNGPIGGATPPAPNSRPQKPQHFWKKPDCKSGLAAFGAATTGAALIGGSLVASYYLGPEMYEGAEAILTISHLGPVAASGPLAMGVTGKVAYDACFGK